MWGLILSAHNDVTGESRMSLLHFRQADERSNAGPGASALIVTGKQGVAAIHCRLLMAFSTG